MFLVSREYLLAGRWGMGTSFRNWLSKTKAQITKIEFLPSNVRNLLPLTFLDTNKSLKSQNKVFFTKLYFRNFIFIMNTFKSVTDKKFEFLRRKFDVANSGEQSQEIFIVCEML